MWNFDQLYPDYLDNRDRCQHLSSRRLRIPGRGPLRAGTPSEAGESDIRNLFSPGPLGCGVLGEVLFQPGRPSPVYVAPMNRIRG